VPGQPRIRRPPFDRGGCRPGTTRSTPSHPRPSIGANHVYGFLLPVTDCFTVAFFGFLISFLCVLFPFAMTTPRFPFHGASCCTASRPASHRHRGALNRPYGSRHCTAPVPRVPHVRIRRSPSRAGRPLIAPAIRACPPAGDTHTGKDPSANLIHPSECPLTQHALIPNRVVCVSLAAAPRLPGRLVRRRLVPTG
jgi:hypothetical protein